MEAFGEDRADIAAGTGVSGLSAAALLGGRALRSVPSAGSRSDAIAKDASDGGAAAGFEATNQFGAGLASPVLATPNLKASLALLDAATAAVVEELAGAGFLEAADFAELTENLSRRVEHLQVLAAAAVDRTRTEAINAAEASSRAAGWTTGWGSEPETVAAAGPEAAIAESATTEPSTAATADADADADSDVSGSVADGSDPAAPRVPARAVAWSPADDGARNTAEFLRTRLRISTPEARRRLALADATLPRTGLAGRPMPPACEETAAALTAGIISSRAATIITTALDKVRHIPDPDAIAHMEHTLTQTAIENDHDFLTRIAHRCIDALDQDGTEPSEENLRHRQGVFLHHKRGGLHHLEIRATTDQYEVLTTVMNTATNPRTTTPDTTNCGSDSAAVDLDAVFNAATPEPDLDRRTLAQQRLDGLVGASKAALAAGTLPATGGLRPQVMVTVGYRDLLNSIETAAAQGPRYDRNRPGNQQTDSARPTSTPWQPTINPPTGPGIWQTSDTEPVAGTSPDTWLTNEPQPEPGTGPNTRQSVTTLSGINWPGTPLSGTATGSGTFTYTGPVTASTIRKIACDADIIPVLLGSEGRILDIGRTTRIFPPHIRKGLNARDQGCAFPNCTIPASWCEAHHITYWSRGGPTSTDNGVLLCTHHHHLIHKEQWKSTSKRNPLVHPATPHRPPPTTPTKPPPQNMNQMDPPGRTHPLRSSGSRHVTAFRVTAASRPRAASQSPLSRPVRLTWRSEDSSPH
jgi:hypothetical protein